MPPIFLRCEIGKKNCGLQLKRVPNCDIMTESTSGVVTTMAQKNKIHFSVRIEEDLYKKMAAVAAAEGRDINNHILHLVRTNVQYHERIHGRIDTSSVELPDQKTDS